MRRGPNRPASSRLRVLSLASEAEPFAKTGGLGDVVGALATAVARLGHDVRVVLPLYRSVPRAGLKPSAPLTLTLGAERLPAKTWTAMIPGGTAEAVFVDVPSLFDRDGLYQAGGRDHPDNLRRFSALCHAGLQLATAWRADVLHAHDWQAALACALVRWAPPGSVRPATVFTIHNFAYQGVFPLSQWPLTGLPPEAWSVDGLEFYGQVNCLKGGLRTADRLTTVSPTYAREIQTPAFGCGLDGVLRPRAEALEGILNGIDTEIWDPAVDPKLPAHYDASRLSGKATCTHALREELGLPVRLARGRAGEPLLIGMVQRLVEQKGTRLFLDALEALMRLPVQIALLGTGDAAYHHALQRVSARWPDRLQARVAFDDGLAHRITAGAHAFLMPSQFEPCGLNQMYSMRYGTVPIVRKVGGLADTVIDDADGKDATGFVFGPYTPAALLGAVQRTLACRSKDPGRWRALMRAGLRRDFSWNASAARYVGVYRAALKACG